MLALKFAMMLLVVVLSSFVSHSLSIRFTNQVSFLVNCPTEDNLDQTMMTELLERVVLAEHGGKQVVLRRCAVSTVDFLARAGFSMLCVAGCCPS